MAPAGHTTEANDPIHPVDEDRCEHDGLTKREHFAIVALGALLGRENLRGLEAPELAERAIDAADCLIEALNRTDNRTTP